MNMESVFFFKDFIYLFLETGAEEELPRQEKNKVHHHPTIVI